MQHIRSDWEAAVTNTDEGMAGSEARYLLNDEAAVENGPSSARA